MKPLLVAILLLVAAFCVYGFVASFEPSPRAIYFRIGYAVVGVLSAGAAGGLLIGSRRTV
jgi:hypothetical protein